MKFNIFILVEIILFCFDTILTYSIENKIDEYSGNIHQDFLNNSDSILQEKTFEINKVNKRATTTGDIFTNFSDVRVLFNYMKYKLEHEYLATYGDPLYFTGKEDEMFEKILNKSNSVHDGKAYAIKFHFLPFSIHGIMQMYIYAIDIFQSNKEDVFYEGTTGNDSMFHNIKGPNFQDYYYITQDVNTAGIGTINELKYSDFTIESLALIKKLEEPLGLNSSEFIACNVGAILYSTEETCSSCIGCANCDIKPEIAKSCPRKCRIYEKSYVSPLPVVFSDVRKLYKAMKYKLDHEYYPKFDVPFYFSGQEDEMFEKVLSESNSVHDGEAYAITFHIWTSYIHEIRQAFIEGIDIFQSDKEDVFYYREGKIDDDSILHNVDGPTKFQDYNYISQNVNSTGVGIMNALKYSNFTAESLDAIKKLEEPLGLYSLEFTACNVGDIPTSMVKDSTDSSEFKKKFGKVISEFAHGNNIDENILGAFLLTESHGSGFANGKLIIRLENHHFLVGEAAEYKGVYFDYSNGEDQSKGHKFRKNPDDDWIDSHQDDQAIEYEAFELAKSLNSKLAYNATSYGLGQILGANYDLCGYSSAEEMFNELEKGEIIQMRCFFSFIDNKDGLLEAIRSENYDNMAKLYNGESNISKYSPKIKENYEVYKNA